MSALESHSRITPFLWFDKNAEEAVNFYLSIFKNSRRLSELRNNSIDDPRMVPKGGILTVSFFVRCDSQDEVDYYWSKLSAGGSESQCGWLKDKFGLSWQIVPSRLPELIQHPKAMHAMMGMKKLVIAELEAAAHSPAESV